MADMTQGAPGVGRAADMGLMVQLMGAAVSVGLIAGVGYWGYKLVVRDATGIPVVAAMEGPMREAPTETGGALTPNTGLAVNDVIADGGAAAPEDRLVLAPPTPGLTEEDLLVTPTAEDGEVVPEGVSPTVVAEAEAEVVEPVAPIAVSTASEEPMTADQMLALADQIAAGATPLSDLAEGAEVPVAVAIDGAVVVDTIPASVPGVTTSYRPPARPAGLNTTVPQAAIPQAAAVVETPISPAPASPTTLTVGTAFVQLGTSATVDGAEAAWTVLTVRFDDFMAGREMLVQEASTNGEPFYRLRATGFADITEARRFCTALVAEGADCIPLIYEG